MNRVMNLKELKRALDCAVKAAREVGQLMRKNLRAVKKITEEQQHDIKLELDVRSQKMIERRLQSEFLNISILGEEGVLGDQQAAARWVVDPIDGTVNFSYGIPHACVSIALQIRNTNVKRPRQNSGREEYQTWVGVVYDPFCDELWTSIRGQPARLNGKITRASRRTKLKEAIVSLGFAKYPETLEATLPTFNYLIHRVRKVRITGAAALAMVYVASGRFDAYLESGVRLWDIAAGGLILESAGGEFWRRPLPGEHTYRIVANNGLLRRQLRARK
ncbi:MAG: inositol monophosphatase [Pedosphaera sp.]|nr:inositol monophosphatase [Pedosphaera sp.]